MVVVLQSRPWQHAAFCALLASAYLPTTQASFKFGLIGTVDPEKSMLCFIGLFIVIITFEFMTGLIDYSVKKRPIYGTMMEKMYKELTLMGVLALVVIMLSASGTSGGIGEWILTFEFAHIVVFFTTMFFVVHALVLMYVSYGTYKANIYMSWLSEGYLLKRMKEQNFFEKFIFDYFPAFSKLREAVEYKCLELLFVDTYWLPADFDVPMYISGCFERYALKTVEVGVFNWSVLAFLIFCNYLRMKWGLGFNCKNPEDWSDALIKATTDSLLAGESVNSGTTFSTTFPSGSALVDGIPNPGLGISEIPYMYYPLSHRLLAGTGVTTGAGRPIEQSCMDRMVYFFFLCSIGLVSICLTLNYIGYRYECRLIRRIGVRKSEDYLKFLKAMHLRRSTRESQEVRAGFLSDGRATMEELLEEIEDVADEHEEEEEENKVYKDFIYRFSKLREKIGDLWNNLFHVFFKAWFFLTTSKKVGVGKLHSGNSVGTDDVARVLEKTNSVGTVGASQVKKEREPAGFERVEQLKKKLAKHHKSNGADRSVRERLSFVRAFNDSLDSEKKSASPVGTRDGFVVKKDVSEAGTKDKENVVVSPHAEKTADTDTDTDSDDDGSKNHNLGSGETAPCAPSNVGSTGRGSFKNSVNARSGLPAYSTKRRKEHSVRMAESESVAQRRKESVVGAALSGALSLVGRARTTLLHTSQESGSERNSTTSDLDNFRKIMDTQYRTNDALVHHMTDIETYSGFFTRNWLAFRKSVTSRIYPIVEQAAETASSYPTDSDTDGDGDDDLSADSPNLFGQKTNSMMGFGKSDKDVESGTANSNSAGVSSAKGGSAKASQGRRYSQVLSIEEILGSEDKKSSVKTLRDLKQTVDAKNNDLYSSDFDNIYFYGSPELYYRAVEATIMMHCFYLGVWTTNFITITLESSLLAGWWSCMIILPVVLISLPALASINRTCSKMQAVIKLNLQVMRETVEISLEATEQTANLRENILERVHAEGILHDNNVQKLLLVDSLFGAVDIDGSCSIDHYEFRVLLRQLELHYSDQRFEVLFSAIDIEAAGVIKKYEFYNLLFPCTKRELRELMEYYAYTEGDDAWVGGEGDEGERRGTLPDIGTNEKIRVNNSSYASRKTGNSRKTRDTRRDSGSPVSNPNSPKATLGLTNPDRPGPSPITISATEERPPEAS